LRLLKIARVSEPAERRPRKSPGRSPRFGDPDEHGREIESAISAITVAQKQRAPVLGVDPRLILVIEFHSAIADAEIARNDMVVLDGADKSAVVAFADDVSLATFHERLAAYRGPKPEGQESAQYQSFFDSIVSIRVFGPDDRVSIMCSEYVRELPEPTRLRLDVQCWHPGDAVAASEWLSELNRAAVAAGGEVVTTYKNDPIGLLISRVLLPSGALELLAELDVIASIDLLPSTDLTTAELHNYEASELPAVAAPSKNAPVLGLIDSGVASAHPLLAGAVLSAEALSPHITDGEDRHGHGTMVASLAIHGPIPEALTQAQLVPLARIVSVAVLDSDCAFPDDSLWEQDLVDAIEYCAGQGARVINLSLGDLNRPFRGPRQSPIAAIVDQLARQLNVVVVVSTGNSDPMTYLNDDTGSPFRQYVADLHGHADTGLLPPATAAIALTVGGFSRARAAGGYASREPVERRSYSPPGWPSSITRRGLGVESAVKPELVAPAGTHAFEPNRPTILDAELAVVGAGIGSKLLAWDLGTSYAAPLVSRVALGVLHRFPDFSANLVRALVLLGANPVWLGDDIEVAGASQPKAAQRAAVRSLTGYGETSLGSALDVTPHRVVLTAEASIQMNAVHIYQLPIPSSFYHSGGKRFMDVSLTFDPPTRSQRLDYLGNKLEFHVVRDIGLDEVLEVFTKFAGQDDREDEGLEEEELEADVDGDHVVKKSSGISDLLGSRRINFDASVSELSRSANQRAHREFSQKWSPSSTDGAFLVVRSLNRWADSTLEQDYAVAVSLRRDESQAEIYNELALQLEAVAEIELVAEAETEVELG